MYSLIVVDYNSVDTTVEYIRRAWDAMGEKGAGHVVLVQNGQDVLQQLCNYYGEYTASRIDGVLQTIYRFQKDGQDICYCHSGENMGYARGNNLGVRIAEKVWGDPYYIVSNNDLVFKEPLDLSVADKLFSEDASIGVIGPRVITPDGTSQSPQKWATAFQRLIKFYLVRFLSPFLKGKARSCFINKYCNFVDLDAQTGVCDWISGCFMLLRSDAFRKAGMFDEYTFLYAEEMILSRRMESVGYKVWFCQELKVIHNHAQTTKKTIAFIKGLEIDFYAVWYYYKTYTNTSPFLLMFAKWIFMAYKKLFVLIKQKDNQ